MRPRSSLAAVVAVVAVVSLAGCANANPSVAAYVGGTEITQSQLDDAVGGVEQTIEEGQQVSPQAVLNALVHGALADQIAAEHHVVVTDAERDAAVQQTNLAPLLPFPAAKVVAYDAIDPQLVGAKVGEQVYFDEVAKTKVTLNPRYGVLDDKQKLIVGDQSGSLAEPATPTPAP